MITIRQVLSIISSLSLIIFASIAHAGSVTVRITAVVDTVYDNQNHLDGAVNVGDTITGSYTYNSTTPDSNPAPTVGHYVHTAADYGICLSVNGLQFRTDPQDVDFAVELVNNHGYPASDNYLIRSSNNIFDVNVPANPWVPSQITNQISWQLDDPSLNAIHGIELTETAPVLADWQSFFGLTIESDNYAGSFFGIRATVTEAILGESACSDDVQNLNRYIGAAALGGNQGLSSATEAILYRADQPGEYAVIVKRLVNGQILNQFTLPISGVTPVGMVGLDSINFNGTPDLAFLYPDFDGQGSRMVIIDSITSAVLHTWSVGSPGSTPIAIKLAPDFSGDGVRDVSILNERPDNTAFTEIFNPRTGQKLMHRNYD